MARSGKPENLTRKGLGRPKGALNKTTIAAKELIANVAEKLGGEAALLAWVKKSKRNQELFWTSVYPRLIPLQTDSSGDKRSFEFRFVQAKKADG